MLIQIPYSNRIRNAENAIERAREQIAASRGKAENYGFASMAAVRFHHLEEIRQS